MKKYITVLMASLALAIISGCGQQADMASQPETEQAAQWRTEGFAAPGELEEQAFWAGQYLPWEHKDQDAAGTEELICLDSGVCGELFWYFGMEPGADGILTPGPDGEYVLEIFNTADGEYTVKRFSPRELGLEDGLGYLVGMDMLEGEHYMFRWLEYEQDGEGLYYQTADRMVYTDFAGDLRTADFWELYLEKEIVEEKFTELPLWQSINCRCDGKGNSYVIKQTDDGSSEFWLFDKRGEILLEYEGTPGQQLVEPLRTPDGELILPVYDDTGKYYEFLWADTAEGTFLSLARVEAKEPFITQMYGMLGDDIYYRTQRGTEDGIVRWNIKNGSRAWVFDFREAGLGTGYRSMLALREGQTPFLRLTKYKDGKTKEWLTALGEQRMADDGSVRVADLTGTGEQIKECAMLASIETPNFRYEYEGASAQEARDKILAELSQGKGPDLLFVTVEDLYLLEEKGLLLDIGELIPQELQEELLPGALEIGTVDGRLMGVPAAVQAETLVVAGDIWPEDTWRLEDVIGLMEEGKLEGTMRSPYLWSDYLSPSLTISELVYNSLGDSFLIDWENRKSHFDDDRFVRLLELTSTDMSGVTPETDAWLNEGKNILWGYFMVESSFLDFFEHVEEENGRIIGYPTEGACGSYLVPNGGVLVVNANIAQKEAAACFLETLLGEELQKKNQICLSVRKLSPEDYIVSEESGRLLFLGGMNASEVTVFQDGTTSLHRAKAFLESCVALPPRYFQINRIISEELSAMYAEKKSPRTTAEIINSRVQLYLDEGN